MCPKKVVKINFCTIRIVLYNILVFTVYNPVWAKIIHSFVVESFYFRTKEKKGEEGKTNIQQRGKEHDDE